MSACHSHRARRTVMAACLLLALTAPDLRAERPRVYAITNARVVAAPGRVLENATVVLRDGLIEAVGTDVKPPTDAFVVDGTGRTLTYGFIDACSEIGQRRSEGSSPAEVGAGLAVRGQPRETPAGALHPLPKVRPERRVVDSLAPDASIFEKHRAMGFTAALTLPSEGIFRGQPALISLGDGSPSSLVVIPAVAQTVAFETGGFSRDYPGSLMGVIAAVRQTFYDTQRQSLWEARYKDSPTTMPRPEFVPAFAALAESAAGRMPVLFDVRESANVVRALAIGKEFSLRMIVLGSGLEVAERGAIAMLKEAGVPVILPLAYPEKPKVEDVDEALNVSLQDLERWDLAPTNPSVLQQAGIPIALGTCRLPTASDFPTRLRKAIGRGLSAEAALAALTEAPAKMMGAEGTMGTIDPGKIANLALFEEAPSDGEMIFAEKAKVVHVFVDGEKFDIEKKKSKGDPNAKVDPRGTWAINFTTGTRTVNRTWTIKGSGPDYSGTAETQRGVVDFTAVKLTGNELTVVMPGDGNRPSQELVVIIKGETLEGSGDFGGQMTYRIEGTRSSGPEGGAL